MLHRIAIVQSGDYMGMTETKLGRDDEEFSSFAGIYFNFYFKLSHFLS